MTNNRTTAPWFKLSSLTFKDPQVRSWSKDAVVLAFYLLSSPHRNTEGIFHLPPAYGHYDVSQLTPEEYARAMKELQDSGFILWDAENEIVMLRRALAYSAPKSADQVKGAMRALAKVPSSPHLQKEFLAEAERYAPRLAEALADEWSSGGMGDWDDREEKWDKDGNWIGR